jgi:hypothetical protein
LRPIAVAFAVVKLAIAFSIAVVATAFSASPFIAVAFASSA